MAGRLVDEDPQTALQHAQAAKNRAPRLQITREALGETAYAAERFDIALTEFRAVRRMSGADDYLAAMADCERALGRSEAALKLVKEGLEKSSSVFDTVELRLVEAGVRAERGQIREAARLLEAEIQNTGTRGSKQARARLRYAYADLLDRIGDKEGAEIWFKSAAILDPGEETDAAERLAALQGVVIEYDYDEDDEVEDVEGGEDGFAEEVVVVDWEDSASLPEIAVAQEQGFIDLIVEMAQTGKGA
jgi:tetratricopeptide (TPR) repeat protein